MAEQRDLFGSSLSPDEDVTVEHLSGMRYLDACLMESMRLFPPVPLVSRVLRDDLHVGGKLVPRSTVVVLFFYMMHRNPNVWEDPDQFRPERHLNQR